jgi:3'(2'), 5'-bisphosphate nucleotidase
VSNIASVIAVAKQAGNAIMEIYHSDDYFVGYKSDKSPVTKADLKANRIIIAGLKNVSDLPVLTEESPVDYEQRKDWERYWLVDPLDGTKNFIAKNYDFTVNIALIEAHEPILGVVYLPLNGDVYFAEKGLGAFKNGSLIFNHSVRTDLIAASSVFHSTDEMTDFFKLHGITRITAFGASVKICKLAEGSIDVYPRLNGTKEWDTAASHVIANEAGCKLIDVQTREPLLYNKCSLKNNHFIASRNDLQFLNIQEAQA